MNYGKDITNTKWFQELYKKQMSITELNVGGDVKKIRCKCNVCGYETVYNNKHDLAKSETPCEMCKVYKMLDKDNKGDYKPKKCLMYRDSNDGQLKIHVECHCAKCNSVKILSLEDYKLYKDKLKCDKCGKDQSQKMKPAKRVSSVQKVIEQDKNRKLGETPNYRYMWNDQDGIEERVWINNTDVGRESKNLKVIGAVQKRNTLRAFCVCKDCNKTGHYDFSNVRSKKTYCTFCRTPEAKAFHNKTEDSMEDFKGNVYNGMMIKKWYRQDDDYRCIVKCCSCGEETEQDLYMVKECKVFCNNCISVDNIGKNRNAKKASIICDKCGYVIENVTYRDLYSGNYSHKKCPACKNNIDLTAERGFRDSDIQLRNNLNPYLGKGLNLSRVYGIKQLAVFGEAFKNRDGEICYNCLCMGCNKELVLTQEQIDDFKHQYCNDDKYKYMTMFKYVADESIKKGHDKEVMDENLRK